MEKVKRPMRNPYAWDDLMKKGGQHKDRSKYDRKRKHKNKEES